MPRYEYKVVPAPKKAGKVKGVKGTEARFAHELATLMNQYGADGWEYQRTDTLPCEERSGLTGRTTVFQNMLVFRRVIGGAEEALPSAEAIRALHARTAPEPVASTEPEPVRAADPEPAPAPLPEAPAPDRRPQPEPAPEPMPFRAAEPAPVAEPEREAPVAMPSFRSSHAAEEEAPAQPTFSSRTQEGRTPRLGAARHPEPTGKAPGVAGR